MPKKSSKGKAKARPTSLVLLASQRVASPQRLPINPDAGAAGRYKMPQLVCIPAGKGKNARVVLDNIDDFAASLQRPASYIVQYIAYAAGIGRTRESNTRSSAGQTSGAGVCSLSVDPSRIEALLESFIEEWVLCVACGLPECNLLIEPDSDGKSTSLMLKCSACGHCVRPVSHFAAAAFLICILDPLGAPFSSAMLTQPGLVRALDRAGQAARWYNVKTKQTGAVYHSKPTQIQGWHAGYRPAGLPGCRGCDCSCGGRCSFHGE